MILATQIFFGGNGFDKVLPSVLVVFLLAPSVLVVVITCNATIIQTQVLVTSCIMQYTQNMPPNARMTHAYLQHTSRPGNKHLCFTLPKYFVIAYTLNEREKDLFLCFPYPSFLEWFTSPFLNRMKTSTFKSHFKSNSC